MVVTRAIINKEIKYHDYRNGAISTYTFSDLSRLVDGYKNFLIKKGFKKGNSAVIGNHASIEQIALVFACSELGISIVIVSNPYPYNKSGKKYVRGMINPKLRLMLPIDLFVVCNRDDTDKFEIFNDICRFTVVLNEEILDYTPNPVIDADETSILMKCTSSGTTSTPKVITHTHQFISELIQRNSKQFYGSMCMIANLAHGSSPAVYFLPGLISKNVKCYYHIPNLHPIEIADIAESHNINIDHMLVPYTAYLDEFFLSKKKLPNCIVHTLGIIRKSWVDAVKDFRVKDIISIFGTNETSGPFMINQASDNDFSEDTYKIVDNFYKIDINEKNCLQVSLPVYNITVNTEDAFLFRGQKFVHVGRSNLYRVNDLEIDIGKYQSEIDKLAKGQLIVDTKKDNIYLAIWEASDIETVVLSINELMKKESNGLHFISKYSKLDYFEFLNGVKIDNEMLREYFRTKIS